MLKFLAPPDIEDETVYWTVWISAMLRYNPSGLASEVQAAIRAARRNTPEDGT